MKKKLPKLGSGDDSITDKPRPLVCEDGFDEFGLRLERGDDGDNEAVVLDEPCEAGEGIGSCRDFVDLLPNRERRCAVVHDDEAKPDLRTGRRWRACVRGFG